MTDAMPKKELTRTRVKALEREWPPRDALPLPAWRGWLEEVIRRGVAVGELFPVGLLPAAVLAALDHRPFTALIVLDDAAVLHCQRESKARREATVTLDELAALPVMIAGDAVWHLERGPHVVLTAWRRAGDIWIKFVIRLDRKMGGGVVNQVVTAGVVQERNLLDARYERIAG